MQQSRDKVLRPRGLHDGDTLPATVLSVDQRAIRNPVAEPLLEADNAAHGLETDHRELAQAVTGGESSPTLGEHSPTGGPQHGVRGRAGELGDTGGGTRASDHATRYLETTHGRLSHTELAPLLAQEVTAAELAIAAGDFDSRNFDDLLIADLHRRLCENLTPQFVGWRHVDVLIGAHTPPAYCEVPEAMRGYALDLAEQQRHLARTDDELIEFLAFAEGRLLSIHPFVDFNGRATRLFLTLLLRRLDLPALDPTPSDAGTPAYLAALAAAVCDMIHKIILQKQRLVNNSSQMFLADHSEVRLETTNL